MFSLIKQKLTQYGHSLLAKRDYSVYEFRQKLIQKQQQLLKHAKNVNNDQLDDPVQPDDLVRPDTGSCPVDWVEDDHHEDDLIVFIDEMIETFVEKRYLSDERYRDQWMRLYRSRYGAHRIFYELSQKGIDTALINARKNWLADTEMGACFRLWQRKFNRFPQTPRDTQKQKQFLAQKGFDFDTISSMLKAIRHDEEINTDGMDELPAD